MKYYERNGFRKMLDHWNDERQTIDDLEAVAYGDEITQKSRPTVNQIIALINILTTAPRKGVEDKISREK